MQSPLKDQLCKVGRDDLNPQNLKVRPKPYFKRLAADGFQELRALLRGLCLDLKAVQGKVINNKIYPDNLFLTKNYKLCLAEWGYSSFREAFNIQTNSFESRVEPILRGNKDWLVSPEYLAPEVIGQLLGLQSMGIWHSGSSPDVWALGLTIFEIMTLTPIWCATKCQIVTRINEFPTVKNT
jgi:serine/threonine protein kinase